ncbi:MAG: 4Fe-4S dicluster domain-containing protein [archaeon]
MNLEFCYRCSLCNLNCPVYRIFKTETSGARYKAFIMDRDKLNKWVYLTTDCGRCAMDCPAGVGLDFVQAKERLVNGGFETEANKKMIAQLREKGVLF